MNNERKRADAPINLERFPIATEMQMLTGKCFGEDVPLDYGKHL